MTVNKSLIKLERQCESNNTSLKDYENTLKRPQHIGILQFTVYYFKVYARLAKLDLKSRDWN